MSKDELLEQMAMDAFIILTGRTSPGSAKEFMIMSDCVKIAIKNFKLMNSKGK